jgi:hypothetical protein
MTMLHPSISKVGTNIHRPASVARSVKFACGLFSLITALEIRQRYFILKILYLIFNLLCLTYRRDGAVGIAADYVF